MSLPTTTRGSVRAVLAPDSLAIAKAIEIARRAEPAQYLLERFIAKMESLGKNIFEESQSMRQTLEQHSLNTLLIEGKENHWAGVLPESDYLRYQTVSSELASGSLKSKQIGQVNVDYALSDSTQLVRAYSEDNQELTSDSGQALDKLLSSFLTKNNLFVEVSEQGTFIYENDGEGNIRLDKNNKIKADPEVVKDLIQDKNKGFQRYLQKQGIESTVNLLSFPGEAPAPSAESAAPAP
ncbi:MAG: hypothetical protein H0U70_07005 [Tatlockia sp.]|nr:hypothetical protein [Tatlockia sp.]